MNKYLFKKNIFRVKAYAAITTVIILGLITSIISSFMLLLSTDNIVLTKAVRDGKQALEASESCAEVALSKLRINSDYAGNEVINIDEGLSCSIDAITSSGSSYTIVTHSTFGNSTKSIEVVVYNIDTTINIDSWNEIVQ